MKKAELYRLLGNENRQKILAELKKGDFYFTDLVEVLGINPSSLSFNIRKLQQQGLVNRRLEQDELRYSRYSLTEKGKEITSEYIEK